MEDQLTLADAPEDLIVLPFHGGMSKQSPDPTRQKKELTIKIF